MPDPPGFVPDAPEPAPAVSAATPSPTRALSKATTIKAQPPLFSKEWFKEAGFRGTAATAEALPAAGAMIGGILGGGSGVLTGGTTSVPGAVGGAGLLGMGGEAARQLILRALGYPSPVVPATSAEAARGITQQGVEQALTQLGGEGLNALLGRAAPAMQRGAEEQYYRALAPTKERTKTITRDIVPELIQRGESGSIGSLKERATTRAAAINPQLDVAYAQTPAAATAGSGTTILKDLDQLKQRYMVQGKVANATAVNAIEGVQDVIKQYGGDIDPLSLRKLKAIFDEAPAAAGAYSGADLTTRYTLKAQKAAANSIRNIVDQANPDIAALNKEIHFWLDVQKVTSATSLRRTGQSGGLVKTLAPLAAAAGLGGGYATHGVEGGIVAGAAATAGAILTDLATQIVRSPTWRTTSAVYRSRFADALARGSIGDLMVLGARIGLATPAAIETGRQPIPGPNQTPTPTPTQ